MKKNINFGESTFKKMQAQREFAKIESLQTDFLKLNFENMVDFFKEYKDFADKFNHNKIPNLKLERATLAKEVAERKLEISCKKSEIAYKRIASAIIESTINSKFRVYALINLKNRQEEIDALDVAESEKSSLLTQISTQKEHLKTLNEEKAKKDEEYTAHINNIKFKIFHPIKFVRKKDELEVSKNGLYLRVKKAEGRLKDLEKILNYIQNLSDDNKILLIETLNKIVEFHDKDAKLKKIDCQIEDLKNYKDQNLSFAKFVEEKGLQNELEKLTPLVSFIKKYSKLFFSQDIDIGKYINLCGYKKEILKFYQEASSKELSLQK